MFCRVIIILLSVLYSVFSFCDDRIKSSTDGKLDKLFFTSSVVCNLFPEERVYLHFDNSSYYLGETLWFRAYVTDGLRDLPTRQSCVLYVELVAPEGYVVETKKYKLDDAGTCYGEFELNPLLLSGYYEVRAYTRYLLNRGKEAVFSRVFPVFDKVNGDNYDFKNMLDRRRGFLYRGKWKTDELPSLSLNFYPESGHLVNGLECNVAYELLGVDGIELNDTVYIYGDDRLLLKSVPLHNGKGIFSITPVSGINYRAEVKHGKKTHDFPLPTIENEGVVLRVVDVGEKLEFRVSNTLSHLGVLGFGILYRGELSHYENYNSEEECKIFVIEKSRIREGVNRAIVFVDDSIPLSERLFFVYHDSIKPGDRETVGLRTLVNGLPVEKITLKPYEKFTVTLERVDGLPIDSGSLLSMSVTDASSRQTTSYSHNFYTYQLLGSELKGYIPEAGQYFDMTNKSRFRHLDLLMLTNGWTSYDWSKLSVRDVGLSHPMEKGITLKGTFYKKEKKKDFNKKRQFRLIPQKGKSTKFEICYKDSIISSYEFKTDDKGSFQLQTNDFFGNKIAALTPDITGDQMQDTVFAFSLDRYYSPPFRLYDYWERHIGIPSDFSKQEHDGNIKLCPFEYMLSQVEVTAAKEYERYSRPPHSEMRFNYLDEWEYAQDVTFLKNEKDIDIYESNNSMEQLLDELNMDLPFNALGANTFISIRGEGHNNTPPYIKYVGNYRFFYYRELTQKERDSEQQRSGIHNILANPNRSVTYNPHYGNSTPVKSLSYYDNPYYLEIPEPLSAFKNSYTAADVVRSAMYRHNYNWAYWVQLMVLAGEYDSDSIPRPDDEYIKGRNPQKMTDFKEFVIRSDVGTREQFENTLSFWTKKGHAMDNKKHYMKFYKGFLSQLCVPLPMYGFDGKNIDGFNREKYNEAVYTKFYNPRSEPYHPNYVACFIPYDENEKWEGIVPKLHVGSVKRYTMIQGYSESKQFYSPDYGDVRPVEQDCRRTLYWSPVLNLSDGKAVVELYNNSISKSIHINAEGTLNGLIYGTDENIPTRILKKEWDISSTERDYWKDPAMLSSCLRLTNEGVSFYKEKDFANAFAKFNEAAVLGYPSALFYMGVCYSNGEGTEQDSIKAFRAFRAASNHGDISSMHNLANCYMHGFGTESNANLAYHWYKVAADSGYVRSMTILGKCYEEGYLTEKDSVQSLYWYSRAAEKEDAYALYKIGCHYERIDSLEQKDKKELRKSDALKYFVRSAELLNVHAQMKLSEFYRTGRYFKKNKKKSFEWLLHAAGNGLCEAQEKVAECYEHGRGTSSNDIKAYQWYKKAAEQGSELGKAKAAWYEMFRFYR